MIFIIPVIKTKGNAVSFKSPLSGVEQVRTPLPESGKASVPQPISQSVSVRRLVLLRLERCLFGMENAAGNRQQVPRRQQAGHQLLLFALSVSQHVGHKCSRIKAGFDRVK